MIPVSSGLLSNIESQTRNPTAKLEIDWDMVVPSGNWADMSAYSFRDESANVISMEGFTEMGGDVGQYFMSDFDCVLNNSLNKYIPRANKNFIKNPSFVLDLVYWNRYTQ